jgi:superkiller protein 3
MNVLLLLVLVAQSAAPHQYALALYKSHSYVEAADAFRTALASEKPGTPDYEESLMLLGQCLYLSNRAADAIPYLEKASKTNEVFYMLGSSYLRTRELTKAETAFAGLYHIDTGSASAHLLTAQIMIRQDYATEAVSELNQAIALDAHLPQAHYILGEIELARGNPDEAIRLFRQEIALNPNYSMAYYKLGDAYTRKQDWTGAVSLLQQSIWLNPDFSGPFILLGRSYSKLGRLADAESALQHAIQLDPKNSSAHYLLGQTLMQLGRTEEARKMLELSQQLKR